jgi:hypothetical protein
MCICLTRYTYYACNNCPSVNYVTQPNGCSALGLQMVIPRTQAHWFSMFSYVTSSVSSGGLGGTRETYFRVVPGVYKSTSGLTPCNGGNQGIMNSDQCVDQANGWRSLDGGKWWLRSTLSAQSMPSGNYFQNAFIFLAAPGNLPWSPIDTSAASLAFGVSNADFYSGNFYLCSTNDFNSGLNISQPSGVFSRQMPIFNEFVQSNNPTSVSGSVVTRFSAISLQQPGLWPNVFSGLRYSCSGASLIDGSTFDCNPWYSLGAYRPFVGNGFRGPSNSTFSVSWVQLSVISGGGLMLQCPIGKYSVGSASVCLNCPAGMFLSLPKLAYDVAPFL